MARQKITQASEIVEDLPELTAQEMALVEAKGQGLDNCEAYKRAYGASGYSPPALKVRACRKIAEPRIKAWLQALNAVGFANAALTKDAWLTLGLAKMEAAEAHGNDGAAHGYWKEIGRASGFYPADEITIKTASDPIVTLNKIVEEHPDLAASLAREYAIPWQREGAQTETRH